MKKSKEINVKYRQKQAKILRIHIDSTSRIKVLRGVREKIRSGTKFYIVTPNPEIILQAQNDSELRKALNSADFKLPDGVGLAFAERFLHIRTPKNIILRLPVQIFQGIYVGFKGMINKKWLFEKIKIIKGRVMFIEIIKLANKKSWRVFLLGGKNEVSKKTKDVLERSYKKVKIEFADGPELDSDAKTESQEQEKVLSKTIDSINRFKPHLLFVGLGAPKQEKWVYRWLPKLDIGGAMVVGGTFDSISGKRKLPPQWLDKLGFEWFWRLITQPKRVRRIITATIVFPLVLFWNKIKVTNLDLKS